MNGIRARTDVRASAGYLAAGAVLTGVYFTLPAGAARDIVYQGLGGASVLAALVGVRLYRPQLPLPWLLLALANASFVVGDTFYDLRPDAASPSTSDAFYLAGYPLLAAGLILLLVHAGGHHRLAGLAEAGIATFAFALLQWVFLMHPTLQESGPLASRIVNATYPAGDLVLLAGFAGFFVSAAWRRPAFLLLVLAVASFLVADEVYALDSYSTGSWIDAGWMLSYVFFGAAPLHPSMRDLSDPRRSRTLHVSSWRIVLLTAALLGPGITLLVQWERGADLEVPAVVTAGSLVSLLVVWRLTGILRALERLRVRERDARDDAEAARGQLSEQNERLLEADRLKDEFVALISHDLRTPLTSIIGYTELALDESEGPPLDDERRSYLAVVSRNSERLLRLVDDLLFVARLQSGKGLELQPADLDLAAIAQQAAIEAHPRAQAKGLELRYLGASTARVVADRGRMFQLLDNLVANAIKFTPGGGTVEIAVENAGGSVALEVRDTGIGLAPGDAERLFDRFYRTSRAADAQIPGTGLGLFIARAIADAHHGRIAALSRPEGGTTFRVELPAATPAPSGRAELVAMSVGSTELTEAMVPALPAPERELMGQPEVSP